MQQPAGFDDLPRSWRLAGPLRADDYNCPAWQVTADSAFVRQNATLGAFAQIQRTQEGIMTKRISFADRLPKALKRTAGRTDAPQVPANIRVFGVDLDPEQRASIRKGLGAKLGKYATSIERVSVRVSDANGPRGGVDKVCRIKVVLSGLPSVIFESRAASLKPAIDGALAGTERAVRGSVRRRHMKPKKAATRARPHPGD
ncbi:MAG: HPF/RaiA family ribosome-associated protein [Burkholderiales bacterium]|nr:HPF/RaiA family ribosome-associated protein [Burkholderiales bacterium]